MDINYNCDVIVVGAGPAGISAALEVARAGKRVILVDRNQYAGSKNMYGGAVYHKALEEVFKEDIKSLPYERIINHHTWSFLNDEGSFDLTYKNDIAKSAYAIKRFNLESWMVELAIKNRVYYVPNTLVKNLIIKSGICVGIKTELEDYYAPVTILADGVNSLLAKEIGLRNDFSSKDMLLSVKETIKLDKSIIEERFNLKEDCTNGFAKMYFGGVKDFNNLFGMTFLYTFKDTIMLGYGANLADLCRKRININQILDEIKCHNDIAPLIKDGKTIEYSAHLIPEYGYNKMPKLTASGVMVVGDAAGFVNSVHFEGTNFALISGKLAGETAIYALNNDDYSQNCLSIYKEKLDKSFILKDLYSYRNVLSELYKRTNSIENYYPNKIKEFFEIITGANCISKSAQIRNYCVKFIKDRNIIELFKDIKAFIKCFLNIFFGK